MSEFLLKVLHFIRTQPPLAQIGIGASTGVVTSLGVLNLCKSVLFSLGLTILIVELTTENGWNATVGANNVEYEGYIDKIQRTLVQNSTLGISFLAGVLLGFAFT